MRDASASALPASGGRRWGKPFWSQKVRQKTTPVTRRIWNIVRNRRDPRWCEGPFADHGLPARIGYFASRLSSVSGPKSSSAELPLERRAAVAVV